MKNNRLIVVLGMHRSGTSALTRGLQVLGVSLGDKLIPIQPDNPKGFWEDLDVVALNEAMLSALGSSWHDIAPVQAAQVARLREQGFTLRAVEMLRSKMAGHKVFAMKDPRIAKLLLFWREVFDHCSVDVAYVLALRHPLSVAKSLAARDGFDPEKSYLLWVEHTLTSLVLTQPHAQRVLVDFDALIADPAAQLNRMAAGLGLKVDAQALEQYQAAYLEESLRHTAYKVQDLQLLPECPPLCREMFERLSALVTDVDVLGGAGLQEQVSLWQAAYLQDIVPLSDQPYWVLMHAKDVKYGAQRDDANRAQSVSLKNIFDKDVHIGNLDGFISARDQQITSLSQDISERAQTIATLEQTNAVQTQRLAQLEQANQELQTRNSGLSAEVVARDQQITRLSQDISERAQTIATLEQTIATLEQTNAALERDVLHRDQAARQLTLKLGSVEAEVARMKQAIEDKDRHINNLDAMWIEANGAREQVEQTVHTLTEDFAKLETDLANRDATLSALSQHSNNLQQSLQQIKQSWSWRLSAPIRWVGLPFAPLAKAMQPFAKSVELGGGVVATLALTTKVLQEEGVAGVRWRLDNVLKLLAAAPSYSPQGAQAGWAPSAEGPSNDYDEWVRRYDTLDAAARQRIQDRIAKFSSTPKISVIMPVYDPALEFLDAAIRSVRNQLYPHWELCIADDLSKNAAVRDLLKQHAAEDARIKVVYRQQNGHISRASNSALEIATGEFMALLDHDDLLPEHALFWVADAIQTRPDVGLIYSDEDKISESGSRYGPYFKSDLNPELLLAQNMICHLGVYRRALMTAVGGFRTGFEGSQDYDLALRVIEKISPSQVHHIPRVLYHWRAIAGSTALSIGEKNYATAASCRAVTEHLQRIGQPATVEPAPTVPMFNRVRYALPADVPLVSIIIPTRDRVDLLKTCIDSLFKLTTYAAWEVVIVDNGSVEAATLAYFSTLPADRVRVVRDDSAFNFPKLNNLGAQQARGEILCLMNNDIEILTHDWLEEMVSFTTVPEIGCVGARLWYPDWRLQHGGIVVGIGGVAGHSHKFALRGDAGYFGRAELHQSFGAVTGACLMIRRTVYEEVNGLDESFAVAFNDVDFCLRVREAGYRNVWTPYAEMIHHESVSRGHEDTPEKQARFNDEVTRMKVRWGDKLLTDPTYSPNLTLDHEDFSLAWPPRIKSI